MFMNENYKKLIGEIFNKKLGSQIKTKEFNSWVNGNNAYRITSQS